MQPMNGRRGELATATVRNQMITATVAVALLGCATGPNDETAVGTTVEALTAIGSRFFCDNLPRIVSFIRAEGSRGLRARPLTHLSEGESNADEVVL